MVSSWHYQPVSAVQPVNTNRFVFICNIFLLTTQCRTVPSIEDSCLHVNILLLNMNRQALRRINRPLYIVQWYLQQHKPGAMHTGLHWQAAVSPFTDGQENLHICVSECVFLSLGAFPLQELTGPGPLVRVWRNLPPKYNWGTFTGPNRVPAWG